MKSLDSEFNLLWDTLIKPAISKCYNSMNQDFISKATVVIFREDKYKEELKLIYKRKVKWFKKEFLLNKKGQKLDVFITAAIVSRCIIGFKPICYDINSAEEIYESLKSNDSVSEIELLEWRISNDYVNYKIAFEAALCMVKGSLKKWVKEKCSLQENDNKAIYEKFSEYLEDCDMLSVIQDVGENSNTNNLVTSFVFEDILRRDFDYMLFANVLSQIQENVKYKIFLNLQRDSDIEFLVSELI